MRSSTISKTTWIVSERTLSGHNQIRERSLLALSEAAVRITTGLELKTTLQQIADSARGLVQADYAALGIYGSNRHLETFITSGIEPEQESMIDHPPLGRGLLRAVMDERRIIRLPRLTLDERSVGFPDGHPPMEPFLGAPILLGDRIFGNIYLTRSPGSAGFKDQDVEVIRILANHAAAALRNVELHQGALADRDELERRNRELSAVQAVSRAAGDFRDLDKLLDLALDQALDVTGMDAAEVYLLDETGQVLNLAAHRGDSSQEFSSIPSFAIGEGTPGRALASRTPVITSDIREDDDFQRHEIIRAGFRSFVSLPMIATSKPIGTLDLASRTKREFSEADLHLLGSIASQIGLAVENARLYREVSRLAVVDERARIGMDLHDGVIQSIYAVGLTLETVQIVMKEHPDRAARLLDDAIAGLNESIRDIRNFILDLRPRKFSGDLGEGIQRLVREFRANALVEVELNLDLESLPELPSAVANAIFMTTQEALANISRHAQANQVAVQLQNSHGTVELKISDDGRGFDPAEARHTLGHGIANMEARAREMDGDFEVSSSPGEGTTVTFRLPSRSMGPRS